MKYLLLLLLLPSICFGLELDTKNFTVTITSKCQEGEVACSNYTYRGISKFSGNAIELRGSSWHTLCADGVTPCRFLGYKFDNGNTTYYVTEDGLLEVVHGRKTILVKEQGTWK